MYEVEMQENYMFNAMYPPKILKEYKEEVPEGLRVDTLVGIGLSGALVVPTLARSLGITWLVVRKPGDGSHSSRPSFGQLGKRWLFVDDFLATGASLVNAIRGVYETEEYGTDFSSEFVGVYQYQSDMAYGEQFQTEALLRSRGHLYKSLQRYWKSLEPEKVLLDDVDVADSEDLTSNEKRETLKKSGLVYTVPDADERVTIKTFGVGGGGGADSAINGGTGITFDPKLLSWPAPITIGGGK